MDVVAGVVVEVVVVDVVGVVVVGGVVVVVGVAVVVVLVVTGVVPVPDDEDATVVVTDPSALVFVNFPDVRLPAESNAY